MLKYKAFKCPKCYKAFWGQKCFKAFYGRKCLIIKHLGAGNALKRISGPYMLYDIAFSTIKCFNLTNPFLYGNIYLSLYLSIQTGLCLSISLSMSYLSKGIVMSKNLDMQSRNIFVLKDILGKINITWKFQPK